MAEKITGAKEILKSKKGIYIILAIIILSQALYMCYCFKTYKKDFHSDEIWSYGPANSYDYPFLHSVRDWSELQNQNEWLSGKVLDEYLTVEEGERFAYKNIYANTSHDLHQPLYFWILNTICSFFVGKFSWWYAFCLNVFFFVVGQIFLYMLVKRIFDKNFLALTTVFFYGFSQAAVNNCVYIRMYMMITCMGIISMYLHSVLYKEPEKVKKILPLICFVTILGGMTHSFFLAFAGGLSACFCLYYLIRREWKMLFIYAMALLTSAGTVLLIYPSTIGHAQIYEERNNIGNSYGGFSFEWRYLIHYMAAEVLAMEISPTPSYLGIYMVEVVLVIAVIGIPLCFVLRKEKFFVEFVDRIKCMLKRIPEWIYKANWFVVIMLLTCAILMMVTARIAHVFAMGAFATRYVFLIYPYIFVILVYLIFGIVKILFEIIGRLVRKNIPDIIRKSVSICLIVGMLVNIFYNATIEYYFNYDGVVDFYLSELPKDSNYIFVMKYPSELNLLSYPIMGNENFFATSYDEIFELEEELIKLESDKNVYMIIDTPDASIFEEENKKSVEFDDDMSNKLQSTTNYNNETVNAYMQKVGDYLIEMPICDEFTYMGLSKAFSRWVFVFKLR